ncbi:MAG TPA: Glu-tRNA(Gln) amidotransferase subunit GatE [Candidatus Nitrosotenuis sp.]|nr:Glu-tRNA(Gln) amidotransferase subunit GatE [Candidatus Nitrosotenuis sp.]
MPEIQIDKIGLKVGLEIHQQLATSKKLFCSCNPIESEDYPVRFFRRLRLAKSELGKYDPAAVFESSKSKLISYNANPQSSCLVDYDDEPPHNLDNDAKTTALIIASALHSDIFSEIHVMRKIVIDGSNTSGFQRTMLVANGGYLEVEQKKIGVQSICLEEDAAKLLKDTEDVREYSLDRLGTPLVEIALDPVEGTPSDVKKIALTLGRLLRVTRRVTRGIGSIRQDVNVSVSGGGIVEVKGVQQLDQLEEVIMYEARRQHGLQLIAEKLKNVQFDVEKENTLDVTSFFESSKSKVIQKSLREKAVIRALKVRNFAGMFGYEPYSGIRLGKELGQQVRFFGIGGIFHSDELPNYGIEKEEVEQLRKMLKAEESDGFLIIAGVKDKIEFAIDAVINRIKDAKNGVPAETRAATPAGETVFLRPRPGASRMYPETDIPPVMISGDELEFAKNNIPKPWDSAISEIQTKYNLNKQLSEQLFDSDYLDLFESICANKANSPNFVASILCSTITNLGRRSLDTTLLKSEHIARSFELLSGGKITKESLEMIYESIMSGKIKSVEEFIEKHSSSMSEDELEQFLDELTKNNRDMIKRQGSHSSSMLMGMAMKSLRGKVPGEKINKLLEMKISKILEE